MSKNFIDPKELEYNLKQQGITVKKSYHHEDYQFTSVTMPYPLMNKFRRIAKKYNISRSKTIQMLIDNVDENNFFESVKRMK